MDDILKVISEETTDIENEAAIAAHAHAVSRRRWEALHLVLGIPSTILAAAAGVTAFTDLDASITGGAAILAAALSAVSTFLSPGDRATAHRSANVTFSKIRRDASLFRDVDARLVDDQDKEAASQLADRLRDLVARVATADESSPAVSGSSQRRAEKKHKKQISAN